MELSARDKKLQEKSSEFEEIIENLQNKLNFIKKEAEEKLEGVKRACEAEVCLIYLFCLLIY